MVNTVHKVRVYMAAALDDGTKIDLGLGGRDEAEFVLGSGSASPYVESLVASMDVGEKRTWNVPAVRMLGPKMVGRDIGYELVLLEDLGRATSMVAGEHAHHEQGCSCGCDRLRRSLAHS